MTVAASFCYDCNRTTSGRCARHAQISIGGVQAQVGFHAFAPRVEWQTCPICHGRGNVPAGFYHGYAGSTNPEPCQRCHGTGTIETPRTSA